MLSTMLSEAIKQSRVKLEKETGGKKGRRRKRGGRERAIIEEVGKDAATPQKEIKTQSRRPVLAHKKNGK